MTTLTEQEKDHNRALYDYMAVRLCNKCNKHMIYDESPKDWETCRATGTCTACRTMKRPVFTKSREDEFWPSVERIDYVEREYVDSSFYA